MTYSKPSLLNAPDFTAEVPLARRSSVLKESSSPNATPIQPVDPTVSWPVDSAAKVLSPVRTLNVPPQFNGVSSKVPLKPHYLKACRVLTLAACAMVYLVASIYWLASINGLSMALATAVVSTLGIVLAGDNPHQFRTAIIAPFAGMLAMVGFAGLFDVDIPKTMLIAAYVPPMIIFLTVAIVARQRPNWRLQAVLAGTAEDITRVLKANPSLIDEVIACITDDGKTVPGIRIPTIGALQECEHIFVDQDIERVLVATPACLEPVMDRTAPLNARIEEIFSNPLQSHVVRRTVLNIEHRIQKRLFDAAASGLAILMLSPLFIIIAIAVKLSSPGPVFFRQPRWGRNGRTLKFTNFARCM